jgi:hypothetical protein
MTQKGIFRLRADNKTHRNPILAFFDDAVVQSKA